MKTKLPFKTALHIALEGRLLTKVLMVFLCAFSFALVALASTGVFYDQADFLTRAFLYYMNSSRPALVFAWIDGVAQDRMIPLKWIERIQEETGLDFVQHYEVVEYTGIFCSELKGNRADNAVSGTPQAYRDCGVKLVAGKFPEEMDEVAITLDRFEGFQDFGYSYNVQRYVYIEDGVLYTDLPYTFNEKRRVITSTSADMDIRSVLTRKAIISSMQDLAKDRRSELMRISSAKNLSFWAMQKREVWAMKAFIR